MINTEAFMKNRKAEKQRNDNARYLYIKQIKLLGKKPCPFWETKNADQLGLDLQEKFINSSRFRRWRALRGMGIRGPQLKVMLRSS